ncbi:ADP-ribosylation factor-like protein 6-interacting protein 4 [Rhinophrynus dorsalis]
MDGMKAKKRSRSRSSSVSHSKSARKKKKSISKCRESSSSPARKPSSLSKYHADIPERRHKKERRNKRKRKVSSSSSSSSSSSGSSSSTSSSSSSSSSDDSSDSDCKSKNKSHHKKKTAKRIKEKKKNKLKKKNKKGKKNSSSKLKEEKPKARIEDSLPGPSVALCQKESLEDSGPVLTDEQKSRIQAMKPMTKEEWDARQSVIRKVMDPETGRMRLIKGDGEVLEEIVSKDRHKEINKQATQNDGLTFQMRSGMY